MTIRSTGQKLASYSLDATTIADLEIAPASNEDELPTPTAPNQQAPSQASFVDPAILSFNRNARPQQTQSSNGPTPVSPIMIADSAVPSPSRGPLQQSLRGQSSISSIATARGARPIRKSSRRDSTATATLTEPFDALALDGKDETSEKRKSQTAPGIIDLKDIHQVPSKQNNKQPGKGRGWRNTPLIEEKPQSQPQPRATRKQRGRQAVEDPNGWATEDATDIADMGDFDFEGNHAKFDKRKVFDDIRRDDTTADEERLVSFNRSKPRPGTNGGRNLHFTENVLDVPETHDPNRWKSEAGETEDEVLRDEHYSSGRNSRRAGSRRPMQSRKGNIMPNHLDRKDPSPRPLARMTTGSPMNGSMSAAGSKVSFRIIGTNNKPCHPVSPLQMLELEQLCTSELGLTEDMLTENAGRSIAEAALCHDSLAATSSSTIQSTPPAAPEPQIKNVLFLLGNHKSAARAIAAARQLRNRRIRITVCLIGLERGEDHLLEVVRKQLKIYRASLGHVERWDDYQAKLITGPTAAATVGGKDVIFPPDFIVDGLLGVHHAFEELRTDDQATVFSMIKWANLLASAASKATPSHANAAVNGNASKAQVSILSLDGPSGLSATTGQISLADSSPLLMASTHVVCLGAPKTGLLAYLSGTQHKSTVDSTGSMSTPWNVSVADIGLSHVAWQRNGSRRRQGVEFGKEWVIPLKVVV